MRTSSDFKLKYPAHFCAIGDVHGLFYQFKLAVDFADSLPVTNKVLTGDWIDRGSMSVPSLRLAKRCHENGWTCLPGNHEQMLIQATEKSNHIYNEAFLNWSINGGQAVIEELKITGRPDDLKAALNTEINWLSSLKSHSFIENYLFIHAGIKPYIHDVDLQKFLNKDWLVSTYHEFDSPLWIREPFLYNDQDYGFIVVHGHTPEIPHKGFYDNRICVDAGAARGGEVCMFHADGDVGRFYYF